MAAPVHRRSGHSRKAQYSVFFGYIAAGIGAAAGAIALAVSIGNPGFLSGLRGAGAEAVTPASRVMARSKAGSESLWDGIAGYIAAGSQNAQLKRELGEAKSRLVEADAQAEENRRLKTLLGIMEVEPRPVLAARLVGSTSTSTRRFATLAAGSKDGVAAGMPLRSARGLVGRVLETSRSTARILLITDSESVVPVRRARDGVDGYVQGRGDGTLVLRLNTLGLNPLKPGDALVTSGSGGLYRPGTPVAVVWKVTSDGAIARVLADPAASGYVVVDQPWAAEAGAGNDADAPATSAPAEKPGTAPQ